MFNLSKFPSSNIQSGNDGSLDKTTVYVQCLSSFPVLFCYLALCPAYYSSGIDNYWNCIAVYCFDFASAIYIFIQKLNDSFVFVYLKIYFAIYFLFCYNFIDFLFFFSYFLSYLFCRIQRY